jgi:hypothetical protein
MAQQRGPQPKRQTAEPARFVHCPPLPLLATPWRLLNKLLEGELRREHCDVLRVCILSREILPVGGPAPSASRGLWVEPGLAAAAQAAEVAQ